MWSELEDEISADESYLVSAEDLGELRGEIRLALQSGPLPERKALMQTLVAEIRGEGSELDPAGVQGAGFSTTVWIGAPGGSAPPDLIAT